MKTFVLLEIDKTGQTSPKVLKTIITDERLDLVLEAIRKNVIRNLPQNRWIVGSDDFKEQILCLSPETVEV